MFEDEGCNRGNPTGVEVVADARMGDAGRNELYVGLALHVKDSTVKELGKSSM